MSDVTNKEMVSVPRELLEKIEKSWRVPDGCPTAIWDDVNIIIRTGLEELRELLAAPVEDVRTVGEEPVAWLTNGGKSFYWPSPDIEQAPGDIALYRHPQRPVVLPERRDENPCQSDDDLNSDYGWNACLDAVEALNK